MRPILVLAALVVPVLVASPVPAPHLGYVEARYVANAADCCLIRSASDSFTATGVGGFTFGNPGPGTWGSGAMLTVRVAVADDLRGGIDALVCQDMDNDLVCDLRASTPDRWACITGGLLASFEIVRGASSTDKRVSVLVASPLQHTEGCNTPGQATTGMIRLTLL